MPAGPASVVDGPRRTPPLHSLLVASPPVEDGERWAGGFTWRPDPCGALGGVLPQPCNAGTDAKNVARSDAGLGTNAPVWVWEGIACTTLDQETDYEQIARDALAATESFHIARELWLGDSGAGNPALDTAAGLTTVGTGLTIRRAVLELENALAVCSVGRRSMIHSAPGLLDWALAERLVERTSPGSYRYVTAAGTEWVGDAGYPGTAPDGAGVAANRSWLYATTTVLVRHTSPDTFDSIDRSVNTRLVIAERIFAAYFDPCCRLAAEVVLP